MRIKSIFSLENSGASVLIHLVVIGVMLTTFHRLPDKIIAPEVPKIMVVDLTQVKITREPTRANTRQEPVAVPTPRGQEAKPAAQVQPAPEAPQPVVRTVTVQRDRGALHRNVNVSIIDALRVAMTRCWQIDTGMPGLDGIVASAHLAMARGGFVREMMIENEDAIAATESGLYVLDTIRTAIANCQPFTMLPDEDFGAWRSIKLNFFPLQGAVN
ncbi:MAG: hypothetical protein FWD33_03055 [Alphaproteobacteria bacterium]|nr:hypothetical protein [Alphaproteobacteria bacterium]